MNKPMSLLSFLFKSTSLAVRRIATARENKLRKEIKNRTILENCTTAQNRIFAKNTEHIHRHEFLNGNHFACQWLIRTTSPHAIKFNLFIGRTTKFAFAYDTPKKVGHGTKLPVPASVIKVIVLRSDNCVIMFLKEVDLLRSTEQNHLLTSKSRASKDYRQINKWMHNLTVQQFAVFMIEKKIYWDGVHCLLNQATLPGSKDNAPSSAAGNSACHTILVNLMFLVTEGK